MQNILDLNIHNAIVKEHLNKTCSNITVSMIRDNEQVGLWSINQGLGEQLGRQR